MPGKSLINSDKFCLTTFSTTHAALNAEKVLAAADLEFLVVPTPREISAGCGLSIRFFCADLDVILARLKENKVNISKVYQVEKGLSKIFVSPLSGNDK